jgi:hypothetical protein
MSKNSISVYHIPVVLSPDNLLYSVLIRTREEEEEGMSDPIVSPVTRPAYKLILSYIQP